MENNNMVAIIVGIVIIAVAVTCAVVITSDSDKADADDMDISGYWYAVEIETYDENDDYVKYTLEDEEIVFYDMAVYNQMNQMIRGYTAGSPFAGSVVGNVIEAVSNSSQWIKGFVINGNTLNLTIVETGTVDGESTVLSVSTGTYCTERSQKDVVGSVDVKGTWDCVSATCLWSEGTYDLAKGQIKITEQNDSLFKGTMDQEVGDTIKVKDVYGLFTSFKFDQYSMAVVADDSGFIWTAFVNGDGMIVEAQDISDADENLGEMVTIERIYSRDGGEISMAAPMNLEGSTWTTERLYYIYSDYDEGVEYADYFVTFEKQVGSLIYGKIAYNKWSSTIYYEFVGYIYGDSQILIDICGNVWDSYNQWGTIIMEDENSMTLVTLGPYSSYSYARELEFNRSGAEENYDIVGHWYNMRVEGIDGTGKLISTSSKSEFLDAYDLSIYGVENNMFYGYFDGRYITGSYVDNVITIRCDVDYGYMVLTGRMIGKDTMRAVEVFYNAETKETSVWRALFTSEKIDYAYNVQESEPISADWEGVSARSYNAEGDHVLKGSTVTINRQYANVFRGTMEQIVGTDVQLKNIKGIMSQRIMNDDGIVIQTGYIIDETGFIWSFMIKEGVMSLYCNLIGESAETAGKAVAVERIYNEVEDEDESIESKAADGDKYLDLEGTWKASKVYYMYENGRTDSKSVSYEFTITQDRALFCGTSTGTSYGTGTFVGFSVGDRIDIMSNYGGDSPDSGYGLMSDNGSIYLVEYYELNGEYVTMICTLVKQ